MSGYTDKEAGMFREPIVFNLLRNMAAVAECAAQWGLVFEERLQPHAARLRSLQVTIGAELDKETGAVLAALWRDPAAIGVMARANETAIDDAHSYFMSQVGRIAAPDYVPSTEDILRCRVKTLGIVETRFHYKNSPSDFVLVDVGGQRTERRKWIHVFDDVTIVLYVISLSDYDLLCEEDNATNRLTESWQLFGDVANNKFFARTNMVVFYNKNDLFVQKAGKGDSNRCCVLFCLCHLSAFSLCSLFSSDSFSAFCAVSSRLQGPRDGRRNSRLHSAPVGGSQSLSASRAGHLSAHDVRHRHRVHQFRLEVCRRRDHGGQPAKGRLQPRNVTAVKICYVCSCVCVSFSSIHVCCVAARFLCRVGRPQLGRQMFSRPHGSVSSRLY